MKPCTQQDDFPREPLIATAATLPRLDHPPTSCQSSAIAANLYDNETFHQARNLTQ
jgi:hypothetical protein